MVEMDNCSTPPFDQKSYEETTTLFGIDDEDIVVKRRRKRRSLGRRVSFAETPAYHIYARDDEYISPSHERQDAQGSAPPKVPQRKSPRLASKRQAVDTDDKENWGPVVTNLSDDCVRRRSKNPLGEVEQTSFSPGSRPPSWHPVRNTSTLAGDGREISGFVDTGNMSSLQKEHVLDEDVTLDSTTFTFKLSQLHNLKSQTSGDQDMLIEPASSIKRNKGLRAGRESPASGCNEHDMSMSFTMIKPIIRPEIVDLQPGLIDEPYTDMSITMQVPRKQNSFLGIDATKQAEVIEIMKATLSKEKGDGSVPNPRLGDSKSHTSQKILQDIREKLTKADEEIVVSETTPRAGEMENTMTSTTYGGVQKVTFALAAVPENGVGGQPASTAGRSGCLEDTDVATVDYPPEGLTDILHCPVVCHEYDGESPTLPASTGTMENTETMDVSLLTLSASAPASEAYRGLALEPSHIQSSDKSSLQELVQQEESGAKLLAILPEKETLSVAGNTENVVSLASFENNREQNTVFTESEGKGLVLEAMLGNGVSKRREDISTPITAANLNDITVAKHTRSDGEVDNVSAPGFSLELENVSPGLTASYKYDEATSSMDMSVSPTSTVFLAKGVCKHPVRELDRSITMDIPSLQDLVREEEDEDMITDTKMDTEVTVTRMQVPEPVGNSPTYASRKSQGSDAKTSEGDGKPLVEKDLRRRTCFNEEGSQFHRDEVDQDRSITMCVPRLEDIIREQEAQEEKEDHTVLQEQETAARNVSFRSPQRRNRSTPSSSDGYFSGTITAQIPRCSDLLAADSVSLDIALAWNKNRSSWVAPPPSCLASTHVRESEVGGSVSVTLMSDSDMELVDDCDGPLLCTKDTAHDVQLMNSPSTQILGKGETADFQVVHLSGLGSSLNLQNVTPTSGSGESMDVVGDTRQSMLHLSSVPPAKISKQDEILTPSDYSVQMVIVGDQRHRHMASETIQILDVLQDHGNKSSDWSGSKLLQRCENRSSTDGSVNSMMMLEDTSEPKSSSDLGSSQISPTFSPSANSKPSQFLSLYLDPDKHSQNEARVRDYRSYTPSPITGTVDAKEVINSVLRSAARLATTPQASLHQRFANIQSMNGSRKSRFTAAGENKTPQPLVSSIVVPCPAFSSGSKFQMSPKMERHRILENLETPMSQDSTEHQDKFTGMLFPSSPMKKETGLREHNHPPPSTMKTVDENLSFTGRTTETQQDPLRVPQEKVTLLFNSGRKVQHASGNPTKENAEVTSSKEVEQASSQADEPLGQRELFKDCDNISVDEFLKLAEVQSYARPARSSPVITDHSLLQADGVSTIHDAFRLSLLVKPKIMHMEDACNLVQHELQKLRTSEARLEEALSASNPSLFSRFQTVGAAEKQRLKVLIERLQTKCRSLEKKNWLHFLLRQEVEWSAKLLESRKELQSHEQALLEGNRFVVENYKQIQDLQARIRSKASKGEEFALEKLHYLKEQLADVSSSRKVKLEKLLKRAQITEEAWRCTKERMESSQCRVHDLQTKLIENVCMGRSQAGELQIAARPDFYVKEMVNRISILKAVQDGLEVKAVGHDMVELSYSPMIRRRLVVTKSLNATNVTKSTWDLDLEKIELMFPGINAIQAFQQTLTDGADYVSRKPHSLRSCIQGTRFLVGNFLLLMEEVGRCRDVTNHVAGRGVLVVARFQIENDKHMQLGIKFLDCSLSAKFIVTLDLRCAQLNGYPFGAMPTRIDISYCPPRVSPKLTSAALEAALATVEPGYHRVERLCATVGSLLASIKK